MRDDLDPGTNELFGAPSVRVWGFIRPWGKDPRMTQQVAALRARQCDQFLSPAVLPKSLKGIGRISPAEIPTHLSSGDTLFVERLALLQTGLKELLELLQALRQRDIRLVALAEEIDSRTAAGGFVLAAAAFLAKCDEHWREDRSSQRAKAREARGRLGGRPETLTEEQVARIRRWIDEVPDKRSAGTAAKKFGLPRSTLYRRLAQRTV